MTAVTLRFVALSLLLALVCAFQPAVPTRRLATARSMGFFDFDAIKGSGSASNDELDDMWEAQQAILRERRGEGTKSTLKKKYAGGGGGSPKLGGGKMQVKKDETYTEKSSPKGGQGQFKMPWDK